MRGRVPAWAAGVSVLSCAGPRLAARLAHATLSTPGHAAGTPEAPQCGFSRKVAAALRSVDVPFGSFDILSDQAVRQGLKVG